MENILNLFRMVLHPPPRVSDVDFTTLHRFVMRLPQHPFPWLIRYKRMITPVIEDIKEQVFEDGVEKRLNWVYGRLDELMRRIQVGTCLWWLV